MLITTVTLLLLLLFGCQSSSPEEKAATPAPVAPPAAVDPADDRSVIVAFGDSLTSGHGAGRGNSYPDYLQQMIDARDLPFRVVNEGVSGDTSDMGLARIGAVTAHNPEFVVIAFGGNDGLRALPVDHMRDNLRRIIRQSQENGATVVLAGIKLPPNYGKEYIDAFEASYAELAQEMDVPFVPFLLEGVGGHEEFMQDDGVHPTAEGNRRVAENVFAVLEPLLREAVTSASP